MLIPEEKFISVKCYELALDCAGIYPQSIEGGVGAYEKRSEWQEGFNAAVLGISKRACELMSYIKALPEDQKSALTYLLVCCEDLYVDYFKGGLSWSININDIFAPAAESIYIGPKDFPVLMDVYSRFQHDGLVAWVAHTENREPMFKWRNENYTNARKYLNDGRPILITRLLTGF